jgi:hypothetical protein
MQNTIKALLPEGLMPFKTSDTLRLGRDNDGGYIVRGSDVSCTRLLLSFGVNDDWSFEQDFVKLNRAQLIAYDGSVSFRKFVRKLCSGLFTPYKFRSLIHRFRVVLGYHNFFSGERVHISKFVGSVDLGGSVSVRKILEDAIMIVKNRHVNTPSIFLKMDIEGAEYEILDDLIGFNEAFSGMAIEFHDCHTRMPEIINFLDKVNLSLIHVHANNFSSLDVNGFPSVLEVTLSSNPVSSDRGFSDTALRLDMPNTPKRPNIKVFFSL